MIIVNFKKGFFPRWVLGVRSEIESLMAGAWLSVKLTAAGLTLLPVAANAQALGEAANFAILGGSSVTNTGLTIINGNLGVSPGSAITGFPPGTVTGTIYTGAASLAGTARADAIIAYDSIAAQMMDTNLSGSDLGGQQLSAGVYRFDTSAQLTGTLVLDTQGLDGQTFHFQIGTTLTTADFSGITIIGGGLAPNIFWQVGTSATLGIGTDFEGNILALTSITITTGAGISNGRAIAINGGVTLDSNNININAAAVLDATDGTYWNGNASNLWSGTNWSPDTTGAVNQNIALSGANVIFSVTGVVPINQNTVLDVNQEISSLIVNDGVAVSITGPNTLTISGAGLITGIRVNEGAGLLTISSNLVLAGNSQTLTVNNDAGMLVSGSIGGTIGLVKAGTGQLTLAGTNGYAGATDIVGGILQLGNGITGSISAASLVTVADGASFLINLGDGGILSNQVVNNGQVGWIAPGSNAQASISVISGTGSMEITSPGTTLLQGTNTFSGGTTINTPGIVLVGNPLGVTSSAFGTGTLNIQQGTVDTLDGQVLQINVGGYAQSGGQIGLHFQGTAPGTYTQYNVTGAANLTGGTVYVYNLDGDYVPNGSRAGNPGGDMQTIVQTSGGLVGQFASNLPAAEFYNVQFDRIFNYSQGATLLYPTITYDLNNAYVTWVRDPYNSIPGLTPNQDSVGDALNDYQAVNPGDLNGALTYLNGQPLASLPGLYDLIAPDELTAIYQMGFHAAEIQAANIQQHLAQVRFGAQRSGGDQENQSISSSQDGKGVVATAPAPAAVSQEGRWNLFVEGLGGSANVDSTANASGYDFNTIGAMMGADYLVSEHLAVGLTGGYANSDASLINGGSIETDSYRGAIFATVFGGGFYLDALAGLAYNEYDTEREALLGRALGNTNGLEVSALLNGGYNFHSGNWTFGPVASLAYTRVSLDSFTESGSLTPLRYPDQHQESLRSNLGARISYSTVVGGMRVTPQARITWQHEYMDSTQSMDSSFASGPGPVFSVDGPEIGRDSALITAGVNVQITQTVGAYAFYSGQVGRDNYSSHNVTVGMRISF